MRDATEGARKLIEPYSERIEALEEENQRLRECLSDDAEYARILMGENERLRMRLAAKGIEVSGE